MTRGGTTDSGEISIAICTTFATGPYNLESAAAVLGRDHQTNSMKKWHEVLEFSNSDWKDFPDR